MSILVFKQSTQHYLLVIWLIAQVEDNYRDNEFCVTNKLELPFCLVKIENSMQKLGIFTGIVIIIYIDGKQY